MECKCCGKEIKITFKGRRVFCSDECSKLFHNKRGNIIKNIDIDKIITAHKICNGADGSCNYCPYNELENCTAKLAKETLNALTYYKDANEERKTPLLPAEFKKQIEKHIKNYSAKKQKYKSGTMLHQYWLGKEEAAKEILTGVGNK